MKTFSTIREATRSVLENRRVGDAEMSDELRRFGYATADIEQMKSEMIADGSLVYSGDGWSMKVG